jgi:hypothetical protein
MYREKVFEIRIGIAPGGQLGTSLVLADFASECKHFAFTVGGSLGWKIFRLEIY